MCRSGLTIARCLLVALACFFLSAGRASSTDPIKIGVPIGLTGANSVVAPSVVQSAELAVEEINQAGGILGRRVEIVVVDDGSGSAGARRAFRELINTDRVDAIIAMATSAARNAALRIVSDARVPYIYTSFYEGRSCAPFLMVNSWVPDQQVPLIIDHLMEAQGAKTFFLIGSDYAFGRGVLAFARTYIESNGGDVVGDEYLPVEASDWTAIITKLAAIRPDAVVTTTAAGAPNLSLTQQIRAAGITTPYANLALDEGTAKVMGADARGILVAGSYLTAFDTPGNRRFLAAMQAKFGPALKPPNELSVPQYEAFYAYKLAVEQAGSTDGPAVIQALANVAAQGPRGTIRMSHQGHAPLTMYLGQVQDDGTIKVLAVKPDVTPGDQCPHD